MRSKLGSRSVVEHLADLSVEIGDNDVVEQCVETYENERADDDADDDLHCGVDIALTGLVLKGGLCSDGEFVYLVLCLIEGVLDLVHEITSYFLFVLILILFTAMTVRDKSCRALLSRFTDVKRTYPGYVPQAPVIRHR